MDVASSRTEPVTIINSQYGWYSGKGRAVFEQFIDSNLRQRTKGTSCIALIYQDETLRIFNSKFDASVQVTSGWGSPQKGKHAEHFLAEYLNDPNTGVFSKVEIFTNYSPCDDCCERLFSIQMSRGIDMSVTFACLYNAVCPHCDKEEYISTDGLECSHEREHFRRYNREALQRLSSIVTVKTFKASESCERSPWEQLRDTLVILDKKSNYGNSPGEDFRDWRQRESDDEEVWDICQRLGLLTKTPPKTAPSTPSSQVRSQAPKPETPRKNTANRVIFPEDDDTI